MVAWSIGLAPLQTEAAFWHDLLAPFILAVAGAIWHCARGLWAPYPERLTGNDLIDVNLPTGYTWSDVAHDIEFDEYGYYKLYSWRSLKVHVVLTVLTGMLLFVLSRDVANFCAHYMNAALIFMWHLIIYRWQDLSLY